MPGFPRLTARSIVRFGESLRTSAADRMHLMQEHLRTLETHSPSASKDASVLPQILKEAAADLGATFDADPSSCRRWPPPCLPEDQRLVQSYAVRTLCEHVSRAREPSSGRRSEEHARTLGLATRTALEHDRRLLWMLPAARAFLRKDHRQASPATRALALEVFLNNAGFERARGPITPVLASPLVREAMDLTRGTVRHVAEQLLHPSEDAKERLQRVAYLDELLCDSLNTITRAMATGFLGTPAQKRVRDQRALATALDVPSTEQLEGDQIRRVDLILTGVMARFLEQPTWERALSVRELRREANAILQGRSGMPLPARGAFGRRVSPKETRVSQAIRALESRALEPLPRLRRMPLAAALEI